MTLQWRVESPGGIHHVIKKVATKKKAAGEAVEFSLYGAPGASYTLERTFELTGTGTWAAQQTNVAGPDGGTVFTNMPVATSNNFWRIRSVR